jgi:hypothetical protein
MYLSGTFTYIVSDPSISVRILNLGIGTLTIPLFYLLVRKVFDASVAVFSAFVLAFLPLHVGLSSSSMTEATFVFETILAILFLLKAAELKKNHLMYLVLSVLCLSFATMTRYEAWLYIPLFPLYYYWKTRRLYSGLSIMLILGIFPSAWLIGNYLELGNFLPAFSAQEIGTQAVGSRRTNLIGALEIIGSIGVRYFGWIFVPVIVLGALIEVFKVAKKKVGIERLVYFSVFVLAWAFILYFAKSRGTSLWHRYLVFGLVIAVPYAVIPFVRFTAKSHWWIVFLLFVAVFSIGSAWYIHRVQIWDLHCPLFITRQKPHEMEQLAYWLRKSPYRKGPILLTKMQWKSSYLPLYFPEISKRVFYVSPWNSDSSISNFLLKARPFILITNEQDKQYQVRIERILKRQIGRERLVHSTGEVDVYLIKDLLPSGGTATSDCFHSGDALESNGTPDAA